MKMQENYDNYSIILFYLKKVPYFLSVYIYY